MIPPPSAAERTHARSDGPTLRDATNGAVEAIVGRNSIEYLRTVFSLLREGRTVVTLRSAADEDRLAASGAETVHVPGEDAGWLHGPGYEAQDTTDVAQVLFTSGTEGASKGILLTHSALSNTTERIVSVMEMDSSIREYVGIPVFHSFGFGRCRAVAQVGGAVYLPPEGFNLVEVAEMLGAGEINAVSAVPTLWRLVLARPDLFAGFADRLRWIEIGSQHMGAAEKLELRSLFPEATIVQHYGLTEASRTTFLSVHDADEEQLGSVGRATSGVEVAIDEEAGSRVLIRGPHLAAGILRDGRVTPVVDAEGWLRTSDEGQLDAEGYLHFLGRADDMINCGGVKISPDRLQATLAAALGAGTAVAVAKIPDELRGEGVLVAYLSSAGLSTDHVRSAATHALDELGVSAGGAVRYMECAEFPLTATGKLRRRELSARYEGGGASSARPSAPYDPPRDEVERFVAACLAKLFGLEQAGLQDSLLDHGADSLRAVEMVAEIDAEYGVELPLVDLYRAPRVVGIAETIRWALAGHEPESHRYVVPLAVSADTSLPKLFIVGGSYGNVLHLHDLATALADVASVYGIQYRGLLDDDEPRETIEATAADFVEEVLEVQPDGPYLLSGYSGGGLIALEMARQLLDADRGVTMLSMIDTRLPARPPYQEPFGFFDRQRIRLIESRRQGKGLGDLARRAARKAVTTVVRRDPDAAAVAPNALPPTKERSERIHAAFRRAIATYAVPSLPIELLYIRPQDEPTYVVGGAQIDFVDSEPHRVNLDDNGWRALFREVKVRSSPGGHYTLAHAPNAEVLARVLREELPERT